MGRRRPGSGAAPLAPVLALGLALWTPGAAARADVAVEVRFRPLPADVRPLEAALRAHIVAAAKAWTGRLRTRDCTITVEFGIRPWPGRGAGRSFVSAPYRGETRGGRRVCEEGAAQEIRTGRDPNGDAPDVEMYFDPAYFRTLWFDPDPGARTAPMPDRGQRKLDAFSVILHELGHAFGFNGFRDPRDGSLPGGFLSAYDRWVTFEGGDFFFNGPNAVKLYGRPVPLARTNNNYHHVGDKGGAADPRLSGDLMNGVTLEWSRRYHVSALDVAILSDCGQEPKQR